MKFLPRSFAWLALAGLFPLLPGCKSTGDTTAVAAPADGKLLVYIGTYTRKDSKGIYALKLDLKTGALEHLGLAAETVSPSFLEVHPDGTKLYAANEVPKFGEEPGGAISAFAVNRDTGLLTLLNQKSSKGGGPCHLSVDATGKAVLAANYGGGSVVCLPVQPDGSLGDAASFIQHAGSSVNPQRQQGPHAHSINIDPANRFAIAADLGLDQVLVYRLDAAKGGLQPNDPAFTKVAPGAGPRHFAFHPSGRFGYVINEMHCTITAFNYDGAKGGLTEFQTIATLDVPVQKGYSTAEVRVHPSGRFLYGSNRGHDSIAVFTVDPSSGKLDRVQVRSTLGSTPRNFNVDPTGNYLLAANQNSDTVVVFRIDPQTGKLTPTGHTASISTPVCVRFIRLE